MRHLDVTGSALLDGRLDDRERERALAHLARCAPCRTAVDAEREVRDRVRHLAEDGPVPSAGLRERLLDIAGPEGPLPLTRQAAATVSPPPTPVPWPGDIAVAAFAGDQGASGLPASSGSAESAGEALRRRPRGRRPARRPENDTTRPDRGRADAGGERGRGRRRPRRWAALGGVVCGAGALVVALAVIGTPPDTSGPMVVPDPNLITVEHDRSTGQLPFNEPLSVFLPGTGRFDGDRP